MKVSIAICTWNRAELLDQTLNRLGELNCAAVEYEVLIVNNNCTDHTDDILSKHSPRLPLRRLFESTPGQTSARNCAIREAQGDLIVWTDDDVLVDPEWLNAYVDAALRWPDDDFFGGPIEPWFATEPPGWLLRHWDRVANAFAARDFGNIPISLSAETLPFGANFATRTRVQRQYMFDPTLGLRPGSQMRCDEVTMLQRMCDEGKTGRWVPKARVKHYIPKDRLSTSYLRDYYSGYGEYLAKDSGSTDSPLLFGCPRWIWRKAIEDECKYRVARVFGSSESWLSRLIASSMSWGAVKAHRLAGSRSNNDLDVALTKR